MIFLSKETNEILFNKTFFITELFELNPTQHHKFCKLIEKKDSDQIIEFIAKFLPKDKIKTHYL